MKPRLGVIGATLSRIQSPKPRRLHYEGSCWARRSPSIRSVYGTKRFLSFTSSKIDTVDSLKTSAVPPIGNSDASRPNIHPLDQWIRALKSFNSDAVAHDGNLDAVKAALGICDILSQARERDGADLLFHIGIREGNWDAVTSVTQQLLDGFEATSPPKRAKSAFALDAVEGRASLIDMIQDAIHVDRANGDLKSVPPGMKVVYDEHEFSQDLDESRRKILGETLQTVGNFILAAADRKEPDAGPLIAYALQVIAQLHHVDAVPSSVYQQPLCNQNLRPPYLHLLSARIMTSLSDAVWRAQEKAVADEAAQVGAKYHYLGHEVPRAKWKVRVRKLDLEVWMELALWICIDNGLTIEAAKLLQSMTQRSWNLIKWEAVEDPKLRNTQATARVDLQGASKRLGGVTGGAEGYSAHAPFVELGPRTISCEVVAATADGLTNDLGKSSVEQDGETLRILATLKGFLHRNEPTYHESFWNNVFLRACDAMSVYAPLETPILDRLLALDTAFTPDGTEAPTTRPSETRSLLSLGLLHRAQEVQRNQESV